MNCRRLLATLVLSTCALPAAAQAPPAPLREHEEMAREVGVWDAETTMWMTPDSEPVASKGTETNAMLGKFWLTSVFEGEMMGEKFTGHMQLGFDPLKKKYVGTWIDSVSPFAFALEGQYDLATHTLTIMMNGTSAQTGQPETAKNVTRYIDDDTKVFEMYMPVEGKDGEWWKMMEIKYKRRK